MMVAMDDLAAFLRARLDEDEQTARNAEGDCWHECNDASIAFHERFGAARVLREVEAKRRMLDAHSTHPFEGRDICWECSGTDIGTEVTAPCSTVHLLALPYADHPDYQEDWKP